MKEHCRKSYIAVPMGCGLFAASEVRDGLTEAQAIASVGNAQRRMLLIALVLG